VHRTAHASEALAPPRAPLATARLPVDRRRRARPRLRARRPLPEPRRRLTRELVAFAHSLAGLDLVVLDVVEVAPDTDPGGRAAFADAKLLRELLLLFA
jgi:hypothetical protein